MIEASDTLRAREAADEVRNEGSRVVLIGESCPDSVSGVDGTAMIELLRSHMVVMRSKVGRAGLRVAHPGLWAGGVSGDPLFGEPRMDRAEGE